MVPNHIRDHVEVQSEQRAEHGQGTLDARVKYTAGMISGSHSWKQEVLSPACRCVW